MKQEQDTFLKKEAIWEYNKCFIIGSKKKKRTNGFSIGRAQLEMLKGKSGLEFGRWSGLDVRAEESFVHWV